LVEPKVGLSVVLTEWVMVMTLVDKKGSLLGERLAVPKDD
jgi:hypothetical protein